MWSRNRFRIASTSIALSAISLFLVACGDKSPPPASSTGSSQPAVSPQPEINAALLTAQINSAPLFESQQTWGAGYLKARGNGPGVVVGPGGDNPNVFAQQFPAKPGDQFKVVARAASVGKPSAKGRFQINWITRESSFVSTSIKSFDVTADEKTFEYLVVAPSGAAAGTLYVVPDGSDDVVRYTEMRLLGKEPPAKGN